VCGIPVPVVDIQKNIDLWRTKPAFEGPPTCKTAHWICRLILTASLFSSWHPYGIHAPSRVGSGHVGSGSRSKDQNPAFRGIMNFIFKTVFGSRWNFGEANRYALGWTEINSLTTSCYCGNRDERTFCNNSAVSQSFATLPSSTKKFVFGIQFQL